MPTYTYACTACGAHVEVVQRFTDPALTDCPECRGQLRKVFHPVGVVFKGSGFYKTDSRGRAAPSDKPVDKPAGDKTKEPSGQPAAAAADAKTTTTTATEPSSAPKPAKAAPA